MRITSKFCLTVLAFAVTTAVLGAESGNRSQNAEQIIDTWPMAAKKAAQAVIKKYGQPNEATGTQLIWNNNGPWKRTIVYKEEVDHSFPMAHKDVLEQFINYKVPTDKYDDLAMFDGSVIAERTKGELSARCDKEEANFLALNLANEVATGKRSVDDARKFYGATIMAMMKEGKSSPYLEKLQFSTQSQQRTADADKPLMERQASDDK
jgi:hypothetical protein